MKNMLNTIKGKKKRHTVDISRSDSGSFQQQVAQAGADSDASLKPRRSSVEPPHRSDSSGKFNTLVGKVKGGLRGLSSTSSPYISDDEDDHPEATASAPQLNFTHYGTIKDEETVDASAPAPKTPQIQVQPEYVEDDPSLTVIKFANAIYDYEAQEDSEMTFVKGDRIAVYSYTPDRWGKGRNLRTKKRGEFPCNRTNVSDAPELAKKPSPRRPLPPGPGEPQVKRESQVQRVAVEAPIGSPQVQRLSFFDNLNQDIAYREAKEKERTSGAVSPGRVRVVNPNPQHSQQQQLQGGATPLSHHRPAPAPPVNKRLMPAHLSGAPPSAPVSGSASPAVRREKVEAPIGSPQVQRLSFFDNLNQDIAYRERKSHAEAPSSGPTITRIVADTEEYPEDERGTE